LKALEEGRFTCFFAPTLSEQNFVGGLVYILGDHMGQIKHAKIPSPKSKEGTDRYVFVANEKISQLTRADIEKFKRDVPKTLMNIRKAQSELTAGSKKNAKALLQSVGLAGISPWWKLKIFRKHFFQRFPQDRLHLVFRGHVLTVLLFLAVKNGWNWAQNFNSMIRSKKSACSFLELPQKVFILSKSKNPRNLSRINILSLDGGELLAIVKVLCEGPILSTLPDPDQTLILNLSTLVFYSLDEEFAQISWWPVVDNYRAALRTSFNNVSPADEQYLCRTKWNGFNLNFPNNSSLCSLADQKIFCGSLNNTDTSTFESEHKERRQKMTSTNGKSLTRDVIKITHSKQASQHFQKFTDTTTEEAHHSLYSKLFKPLLKPSHVVEPGLTLCKSYGVLREIPLELLQLLRRTNPDVAGQCQYFKSLKVDGIKVKKGSLIQLKTPDSEEDNIWNDKVIILDEIVQVQEPQTDPHLWCRALPLGLERQPSGHAKLTLNRREWISLEQWNIKRILQGLYQFNGENFLNLHLETDVRRSANIINFRFQD